MPTIKNLTSPKFDSCHILRPLGYYLIIIWMMGTFLNGSILYIFIRYKKLRQTSTNIFIGGLILVDFIGGCFQIPLPAIALINCRWIFAYVGCVFEAMVAYFSGCSNMYMLCLLSIDRYFVVSRSFATTTITPKRSYILIFCAYLIAFLWALMPLFGWSTYDYEGIGASCSIKWEDRSLNVVSYNITILIFVYLIPVIIMIIANVNIRERRRNTAINFNNNHIRHQLLIERRVAHTISLIIGGFLLAWTPYAITVVVRIFIHENSFPPIFGTIPALFAKTSVVWNPLIYVMRNGNFRHLVPFFAYRRIGRNQRSPDQVHFSVYPYSAVQLPLTAPTPTGDS
ncbi:unnamed protein product [Adineta ricciae]|uniref:G-protein coupled receptors family 1 profile domain-containing protein n=1 Tax=Adineta ricciae TaxID=249248 RepID=A0A814HCI3_ADIRI|nr:unnamed protein product [Adineta ricciae]